MLGEKLFEEKGKITMTFVKEITGEGIEMAQSFNAEVKGLGKFPSGMNMGSGTVWIKPNGMAHGKWRGMMMTKDNEMVVWNGKGHSKRTGDEIKGIMVMTFMTMSEKLSWMNSIIVVSDVQGKMMDISDTGYEWK